jgi:hypothetical protein
MNAIYRQFSVQCPICNAEMPFYRVKRRFNCAQCATTLASNRSTVDVLAAVIYVLLVPIALVSTGYGLKLANTAAYVQWALIFGAVGIGAYCILAPRLLWLETDTWSRDAPAVPAGAKHKVLTHRIQAGTGPQAGAKKRAS